LALFLFPSLSLSSPTLLKSFLGDEVALPLLLLTLRLRDLVRLLTVFSDLFPLLKAVSALLNFLM